jgi:hypothetical protein
LGLGVWGGVSEGEEEIPCGEEILGAVSVLFSIGPKLLLLTTGDGVRGKLGTSEEFAKLSGGTLGW